MKLRVLYLILRDGNTIGAVIEDNLGNKKVISKKDFLQYKNKFENAVVQKNGVIRGKDNSLAKMNESEIAIPNKSKKISNYTIMYQEHPVLLYNRDIDSVKIINPFYLPFSLKGKENLYGSDIMEWMTLRIDNISRTYMNKVYIARQIGRDKSNIIRDSLGLSFTDDFWIKPNDIEAKWETLKYLRDINTALNDVAITGEIDYSKDLKKGYTSLFTTRGHFPKFVSQGFLVKRKEDALYEVIASKIGAFFNISVSECFLKNNFVYIRLFTNNDISLVHASELHGYFNSDENIYNMVLKYMNRPDILNSLQRMFIFNYIIANPDLHEDNYGLLYNSHTFEILGLSPCFDHNVAFQKGFFGDTREHLSGGSILPLDLITQQFIKRHLDIVECAKKFDMNLVKDSLDAVQQKELRERLNNIILWSKD